MGKKSRVKARSTSQPDASAEHAGEVGPRQPCPCGSGRRYKACHGSAAGPVPTYVARPFEGVAGECDLVAMREIVAAATAPLTLRDGVADGRDRAAVLAAADGRAGAVREDGAVWLGLQVQHDFGDPSRDLAAVLLKALAAEPGEGVVGLTDDPGRRAAAAGPADRRAARGHRARRLRLLDRRRRGPRRHRGRLAGAGERAPPARARRLTSVEAAYWTDVGTREHLRWVMPHDEEPLLDALARLHVAGKDVVAEGSRLVGMFRAHGLLVPVWDLPVGTGAGGARGPAERCRPTWTPHSRTLRR